MANGSWRDLPASGLPRPTCPENAVDRCAAEADPRQPRADPKLAPLRHNSETGQPPSAPSRQPSGPDGPARPDEVRAGHSDPRGSRQQGLAEVARGGSLNMVGAAVAALTTLGATLVVTHQFSKREAGAFFTATSAFLVIEAVASLGASTGLVYFIARLRALGAITRIPVILRAAIVPVVIASGVTSALFWGLASPLAHILLRGSPAHGTVTPAGVAAALRALAFMMPFAALLDTLLGATRGYRTMRPTVVVDRIGRQLAQVAGVLVAGLLGSTALLMPLWALPYLPAAVAAWLWLRRIRRGRALYATQPGSVPPGNVKPMSPPREVTGTDPHPEAGRHSLGPRRRERALATATPAGFWRFTTPRAIVGLLAMLLLRFDIVLVAIIKGPAWAAVYTAASGFLVVGRLGSMALQWAAEPRFTELFTLRDRRGANLIYQATTAWLTLLTWPLYLLAIVDGKQLLSIFGHSYRAGGTVLIILSLSMMLATACGQVSMVLQMSGRSTWNMYNAMAQVIVNIGLDVWLIPRLGITGAAIGWAAAIAVGNLVPLVQLAVALRLHPFGRGMLIAMLLSTACFGVFPFAVREVFGTGSAPLAVGVVGGGLLLLAGLWRFRGPLSLSSLPGASALSARLLRTTARV